MVSPKSDIMQKSPVTDNPMDYPLQLTSQLQQLLKSLRKSRQMTQAQLARRLGVVQSRVADIERDPGTVSVEQLMNVLAMLGAQLVVRQTAPPVQAVPPGAPTDGPDGLAPAQPTLSPAPRPPADPGETPGEDPRGQW